MTFSFLAGWNRARISLRHASQVSGQAVVKNGVSERWGKKPKPTLTKGPFLKHGALLKTPQRRLRSIPKEDLSRKDARSLKTKLEKKIEELRRKSEPDHEQLIKLQRMDDRAKATSSSVSDEERTAAFDRLGLSEEERGKVLSKIALKKTQYTPIFFPSSVVRLVRPPDGTSPYEAHFRVSNSMTKPDLWNYLESIYGLEMKDIRTMNYLAPLKRTLSGPQRERPGRGGRTFKKAVVDLVKPFWYPPVLTAAEMETKFRKSDFEKATRNYLMKLKGWRVRSTLTSLGLREAQTEQRLDRLEAIKKRTIGSQVSTGSN